MALTPTTRLGARYPNLAQAADLAFLLQTLATDLDTDVVGFSQGTFALRPAAGKTGWFYWDTTNAVIWYDNGTIWIGPIGTPAAASITQAMLAAGAAAGASYSTTFPTSGLYNGYRHTIFLTNPAGGSNMYDAIYRADLDATYPWHTEGEMLLSEVVNPDVVSATSYAAATNAGPSITLARAGVYIVEISCLMQENTGGTSDRGYMSYDIGGTGASNNDAVICGVSAGGTIAEGNVSRKRYKTFSSASTALVSKYKTDNGTNILFSNRSLAIRPLRLI